MKKILVTGGHGFIAGYTIEHLKELGYQPVTNVRHTEPNKILEDVIVYSVDMTDPAGVYAMMEHVDGAIHLAGLLGTSENIRHAKKMNDVNIDGALNMLEAADNWGVPLVMIGVGNYWMNNTYSISKTTAERYGLMYANEFGTKVNIVRALNAFGPRQKWGKVNKIVPTFVNQALNGDPLNVYGGKEECSDMDMVYVGDVAKVLVDVLERTDKGEIKGEIFQAGTGIGYSVYELAEMIVKMSSKYHANGEVSSINEVPMRAGEPVKSAVIATEPYKLEGGYADVEETLEKTMDYYDKLKRGEDLNEFYYPENVL